MTRPVLSLAIAAWFLLLVGGIGCGGEPTAAKIALSDPAEPVGDSHFRFFSPTGFWNRSISATEAVDPNSRPLTQALAAEVERELTTGEGPWIGTRRFSVPVYRVPANQPTVPVKLVEYPGEATLRSAWQAVPLPPNAHPAAGTDKQLVVWQPHTDTLWEFWKLRHTTSGWQASWGGAMRDVSSNPGVYNRNAWPGANFRWGATACSLAIAGGLITLEDLAQGEINHALAISLPEIRQGAFALPAKRTDGTSSDPLSLPEGAHLQLNPNLNLSALHLSPLTLMIARAAKRYGIFVRDGAGDVTFYAQDPTPTGLDPYNEPGGYFEGRTPMELLSAFPWHHLRLLEMNLRQEATSTSSRRTGTGVP